MMMTTVEQLPIRYWQPKVSSSPDGHQKCVRKLLRPSFDICLHQQKSRTTSPVPIFTSISRPVRGPPVPCSCVQLLPAQNTCPKSYPDRGRNGTPVNIVQVERDATRHRIHELEGDSRAQEAVYSVHYKPKEDRAVQMALHTAVET